MSIEQDRINWLANTPPEDLVGRRAVGKYILEEFEDVLRDGFLGDPSLFNARFYAMRGDEQQYAVMAIHFNTMIEPRAWIEAEDVKRLIEGRMEWVPDDPAHVYKVSENGPDPH